MEKHRKPITCVTPFSSPEKLGARKDSLRGISPHGERRAGEPQQDSQLWTFAAFATGVSHSLHQCWCHWQSCLESTHSNYSLWLELLLGWDLPSGVSVPAVSCYLGSEHHSTLPHTGRGPELPLLYASSPSQIRALTCHGREVLPLL